MSITLPRRVIQPQSSTIHIHSPPTQANHDIPGYQANLSSTRSFVFIHNGALERLTEGYNRVGALLSASDSV
jgi:hypothetical protein